MNQWFNEFKQTNLVAPPPPPPNIPPFIPVNPQNLVPMMVARLSIDKIRSVELKSLGLKLRMTLQRLNTG